MADAGKDVEEEEHSSITSGIASWYNHSGNQSGSSSENWAENFWRTLLYETHFHLKATHRMKVRGENVLCKLKMNVMIILSIKNK